MSWTTLHRRGETLRTVIAHADLTRTGALDLDLPGVRETFDDAGDLLGALQLRWYARLSGAVDRAVAQRADGDLQLAVVDGWRAAADAMPGVRLILDRHLEHPLDEAMAAQVAHAADAERTLLAAWAGLAHPGSLDAPRLGEALETLARAGWRHAGPVPAPRRAGLVDRLKSVLAA